MINAGAKLLFDWFLENFPDYDLRISDAPNGFVVHVRQITDDAVYYGQKGFLLGADYTIDDNIFDLIRAAVPDIIEGIEVNKRGDSENG